ncbi:MAG: hypothetical protein H7832_08375 [Magnetococcus sp. DMHC-6]
MDEKDKRQHVRIKCEKIKNHVEITFEGLYSVIGTIENFSQIALYIVVDNLKDCRDKCFVRLNIDGDELYSRGFVIRKDDKGIVIRVENNYEIFKLLISKMILSETGSLNKILLAKKFIHLLDQVSEEYHQVRKINCWEFLNCHKEKYCSAGKLEEYDGIFGGKNGGRFCAFIDDTSCKDAKMMTTNKSLVCSECSFYKELLKDIFPEIF